MTTQNPAQEVSDWKLRLRDELRMSAMKTTFTFTRDEVIDLMGETAISIMSTRQLQQAQMVGADVARLMELVYVPGAWRCPKCNLRLIASTLSMGDGGMYANNEPQECANGCGSMWRVTEREDRQEAQRFAIEQAEALTPQSSAPAVGDEILALLCEAINNLRDLPINDDWAARWATKATAALGKGEG